MPSPKVVIGTDPAGNAEVSDTVPAGKKWKVKSIWVTFVTDGTAATRAIELVITDGTNEYMRIPAGGTQTLTLTKQYNWIESLGAPTTSITGGSAIIQSLPPNLILKAGHKITTVTVNKQAGDAFGAPKYIVEETAA
jgi:hypothetical protein